MENQRKQKKRSGPKKRIERTRDMMLSAIAVEAAGLCEMVSDLHGCLIHPHDHPVAETAVPRIRQAADEQLAYILQCIKDLQTLDTGGAGIPAGKR